MILTIRGNVPSLKNDKKIIYLWRNGKRVPSIVSSDRAISWTDGAVLELKSQFRGLRIKDYPITLKLTFWFDNKRRHDLDNATATVLDALAKAGVIEDDSASYVDKLIIVYGGLDKQNPRVEIDVED